MSVIKYAGRVALVPKGTYDANAEYNRLDLVAYNGCSYVCLSDTTIGITPTNTSFWTLCMDAGLPFRELQVELDTHENRLDDMASDLSDMQHSLGYITPKTDRLAISNNTLKATEMIIDSLTATDADISFLNASSASVGELYVAGNDKVPVLSKLGVSIDQELQFNSDVYANRKNLTLDRGTLTATNVVVNGTSLSEYVGGITKLSVSADDDLTVNSTLVVDGDIFNLGSGVNTGYIETSDISTTTITVGNTLVNTTNIDDHEYINVRGNVNVTGDIQTDAFSAQEIYATDFIDVGSSTLRESNGYLQTVNLQVTGNLVAGTHNVANELQTLNEKFVKCTQTQYDTWSALGQIDANKFYFIIEETTTTTSTVSLSKSASVTVEDVTETTEVDESEITTEISEER